MQRFVFWQDWGKISVPRMVAQQVSREKVVAAAQTPGHLGACPSEDPRIGPGKGQPGTP